MYVDGAARRKRGAAGAPGAGGGDHGGSADGAGPRARRLPTLSEMLQADVALAKAAIKVRARDARVLRA